MRSRSTWVAAIAIAVLTALTAPALAGATTSFDMSSSITAGGITHARLNGSLTFYAPNETPMRRQYAALFCITDTASDNSLNEMQFVYYYLEGGTHRTRVWRNRAGSGSRACFSAWVDGGLTISLLEAHFRSDRFGERVCYYGTPYLPFWVPATDSCH